MWQYTSRRVEGQPSDRDNARQRNSALVKHPPRRERLVGLVLATAGTLAILALTLTPQAPAALPSPHFCVICGDRGTADAILNVLLFAPFGAGLALMGVGLRRTTSLGFALSSCIELAQLTLVPGREANTGDVVMNTIGALVAWLAASSWATWVFPSRRTAAALGVGGGIAWWLTLAGAAVAMKPQPSRDGFFVQIRPAIPTEAERFPGEISGALLDGLTLTDGPVADSPTQVRRAIASGRARLGAMVHPVMPPPAWPAILVRIVDRSQHTELQLTQIDDALFFEPRLRAVDLRLNAPVIRVDRVFPVSSSQRNCGDGATLRIFGQVAEGFLVAGGWGELCRRELRVPLQSASGWALLLPFARTLGPTAWFFNACWIGGFVLVWSYWLGFLRTSPFRRALVGVAILVVGTGAVPIVFSVPSSTVTDWIAGIAALACGLTVGSFLARRNKANAG